MALSQIAECTKANSTVLGPPNAWSRSVHLGLGDKTTLEMDGTAQVLTSGKCTQPDSVRNGATVTGLLAWITT